MLKVWKKIVGAFWGLPGWKWTGLAVLLSRQLPNGSHDFFQTFSISFNDDFIKNPQTTIDLPFLTHNISAIGGVIWLEIIHEKVGRIASKPRKRYIMKPSKANVYNDFNSVKNLQLKFEIWEKSLCNNRIKTQESWQIKIFVVHPAFVTKK